MPQPPPAVTQTAANIQTAANKIASALSRINNRRSDLRLKKNLVKTGKSVGLLDEYTWSWNEKAGDTYDPTIGVIAQEALEVRPEVVSIGEDGYYRVNYDLLYQN